MNLFRKITFSLISAFSLGVAIYFTFLDKGPDPAMAGMWLAFGLISFALGWPEIAASISFLGTGIKLREINSSLKDMQKVIEADTRAIFELVQTQMRFGGVPEEQRKRIYENLTSALSDAEFNPKEIEDIQERWHFWEAGDYVRGLIHDSNINHPAIPTAKHPEWHKKRKEIHNRINEITPQELKEVFREFDGYNDEVKELIEDFAHYKENKSHRRPDIWEKREHWFSSRMNE